MDPITAAILAAVAAGATAGLTEVTKKAIGDAYEALKTKIAEKFGAESELVDAIERVEAKPDSVGRQTTLQEEVQAAKADQDPDLLALADALAKAIQTQTGKSATTMIATVKGGGAIAQGPGATAVGAGGVYIGGNASGNTINGKESR